MQVLIVDDDDFALNVLENTLSKVGYTAVPARAGREAMSILRQNEIHLVITDWDMPGMNGLDLCRAIRHEDLSGYVYIIMLTGREGAKQRLEGLCCGADDFLNKPLDPEELLVCLKTAERILSLETRDVALFALAKLAESRDSETGAHVERVQSYCRLIMRNLSPEVTARYGVDEDYVRLVYQTSALHDLGKVGIPDSVLLKPGKLTPTEFTIMKTHTLIGAQTLDAALQRFPNARFLQVARNIAATHHEKFDGTGYPSGLVGDQIPLCGRVVAIADVYDALTSRRVYKEASPHEEAMKIIRDGRGTHFDPEIVDAFLRAEQQIIATRERFRDDLSDAHSPHAPIALPPPEQPTSSPCKILLAEDDPIVRQHLLELLSATGEPIFTAEDGRQAVQFLEEQRPRIVVSDWVMPQMDGIELCRYIRSRTGADPVHFVMLTANSEKCRLLEAFQTGVDDFITKPFDPEEVLARVRAGIRATKLHDERLRKATGSKAIQAELAVINSRLEHLTITDELTGLFNRRHAMSRLEEQWALDDRYDRQFCLAMIDIDHFKLVNDTHGHHTGDLVLQRVAGILRESTRDTDAICRIGGEEFLIIFPAQSVKEARICAERCRAAVAARPFNIAGKQIPLTISIGMAGRIPGMQQIPDLLNAADQALYAAKRAGRNLVQLPPEAETGAIPADQPALPAPATLPVKSTTPPTASEPAPLNMQAVLKRCGGDPKFAAAVTDRFRAQALNEVVKIETALTRNDAPELQRIAHSLKSMAAYMAAETAAEFARTIEDLARAGQLAEARPTIALLRAEIERTLAWLSKNPMPTAA
jgi:putative two-component system response regulator